jgi:hypothetical protein
MPRRIQSNAFAAAAGSSKVTRKGRESGTDPLAAEPITAPQHPLGFEQYRRADVDILAADQRARLRELLGVVVGQVADDNISAEIHL